MRRTLAVVALGALGGCATLRGQPGPAPAGPGEPGPTTPPVEGPAETGPAADVAAAVTRLARNDPAGARRLAARDAQSADTPGAAFVLGVAESRRQRTACARPAAALGRLRSPDPAGRRRRRER